MTPPIEGMKLRPYGEDYMIGAYMSLVMSAYDIELNRKLFKSDTGINIKDVVSAKGLIAMIDESTGYQKDCIVKWCDWVTENLWGIEEIDPPANAERGKG